MPRFGRGPSAAAAGRSGMRGGGALALSAATVLLFLGRYLVYQASILRARCFMQGLAGFVIDFIQLLHGAGIPVQKVKPGIDYGILSLPEGRHSEEACQTGYHHLGHAWNLQQSNAPVACPRSCCAQVLRVRVLTLCDAFYGLYCHGLHALPITVLGEHVGLEVGDEGLEVDKHPLSRCPSKYAAHANKIVSEPFQNI